MPFPDPTKEATHEAIMDPRVGDRYTEMCVFWLYVVGVGGAYVTTLEANGPCTLPDDGKLRIQTQVKFAKRLSYGNIPGYWVQLAGRGHDVSGWLERAREAEAT